MTYYFDDKTMRCMRRLALVPRWQTAPAHRRGNVLEHSVGVLMIAGRISTLLGVEFGFEQAMECLTHDKDEAINGDAPSTSKKRKNPADYDDIHYVIMKAADYFESMVWLDEERCMGNTRLETPARDTEVRAKEWLQRACELAGSDIRAMLNITTNLSAIYNPTFHPPMEYSNEGT